MPITITTEPLKVNQHKNHNRTDGALDNIDISCLLTAALHAMNIIILVVTCNQLIFIKKFHDKAQ